MKKKFSLSLFGIFAFFISLVAAHGCSKKNSSSMTTDNPIDSTLKSYLALGDSYTIGQSVAAQDRFPAQTKTLLATNNIKLKDPEYIAVTGWTTTNLLNAINQQNPQGPYDAVSLLIGVNDQYQGLDTAGYRIRFTQLLNKAIQLAGNRSSRVFVLSIPDYSVTPFVPAANKAKVSKEVDEFNTINKQVTLQNNIAYIDITAGSRDGANDPSLIAEDGLHPSAKEYKKWAEKLAAAMKAVL